MNIKLFLLLPSFIAFCFAPPAFSQSTSCGGIAGTECATGQYCDFASTNSCGEGDQLGVCLSAPDFCTQQYDPVCGCDGTIYPNACMANAAGVSVAPVESCMARSSENVEVLACQDGASPQVIVCATKDGENQEYPNPCAAQEDGATNIVAQTGGSCPVLQ